MTVAALLMVVLAQAPAGHTALSGRVVDSEGRPARGALVFLSGVQRPAGGWPVLSRAKSDDEGRFRVDVPPDKDPKRAHLPLSLSVFDPMAGLAGQVFSRSSLPAEGSLQLKLERLVPVPVRVVAPDGKPVAGARVRPVVMRVIGGPPPESVFSLPDELADSLGATTDATGKAEIKGRDSTDIAAISVDAAGLGRQYLELSATAQGARSITLKAAGRLVGRIEADDPRATRGLEVIARTMAQSPGEPMSSGEARATTDAEGGFEMPALAAGTLKLSVFPAEGSKLRPRPLSEVTIEPGKTIDVAIRLEGPPPDLRTVTGRVVGLGGGPVAGASVFESGDSPARTESVTDRDGQFQLSGVIARPTFLFARKAGYRFGGAAIGAASKDVMLTIHKVEEPPCSIRKTLPPLLPRDEELALARRLLDPYASLVLKEGGEAEKVRTLEALARVEPARVLELLNEKKVFNQPFFNSMLGLRVAAGLMEESIDEALAVLEGLEDPGAKAMGYIKASTRLAGKDRAKALAVLDRALLNARAAKEPEGIKLLLMGQVAEQFLDLGQAERGRSILREGEALAKQLPREGFVGYARGAFAEELVQVDLEAGLALAKDLADPREFDRHHGNIAQELGGRDPAQAERVLAMVKDGFQRDLYTLRVVYRMAALDLPRARRLAESMSDQGLKGYALGMMALGLAEAGKDTAREVLESAFESLERSPRGSAAKPAGYYPLAPIAAVLLPVAERIDPKLVDEYLWRSLAMRLPKPTEPDPGDRTTEADVQLATLLARFDRGIARSLIEPLAKGEVPARLYRGELYVAAAAIDPKWGVALVEKLPNDPNVKLQHPKNSARLAVATVLGLVGDQRYRKLQSHYLQLWLPDVEDYDTDN